MPHRPTEQALAATRSNLDTRPWHRPVPRETRFGQIADIGDGRGHLTPGVEGILVNLPMMIDTLNADDQPRRLNSTKPGTVYRGAELRRCRGPGLRRNHHMPDPCQMNRSSPGRSGEPRGVDAGSRW
jgi:hypothetical protein